MKHILITLATALFVTVASAVTLPEDASVTLTSDAGAVIGVGEITDGDLNLTIETGANGFITITFEGEDGAVVTFDGMIDADGKLLLVNEDELTDLATNVEEAGGEPEIEFEEDIAVDVTSLPEEAQAGIAQAAENQAEAAENATEGEAQAGAEASVDVTTLPEEAQEGIAKAAENAAAGAAHAGGDADVDDEEVSGDVEGGAERGEAEAAADVTVDVESDLPVDLP